MGGTTSRPRLFEQNCRKMHDHMARIAITPLWVRY